MLKHIIILMVGLVSLIYLLNPTSGLIEIIPDNFPLVGNLDEAAAITLLLAVLRYYGIDLTNLFRKEKKDDPIDIEKDEYDYKNDDPENGGGKTGT